MKIIHTRNSQELAIALSKKLTFPVFSAQVRSFANGEISVAIPQYLCNAIVVASTVTHEDWMELFLLLDALRGSEKIVLCMSYMGYSRQDVRHRNESFGAHLFSRLLDNMSISYCIILDNHSEPFIKIPTIHVSCHKIFATAIENKYKPDRIVIVSPDVGGAHRASSIAQAIGCDFAICNKIRDPLGQVQESVVLGNVAHKTCILVDDIIDSGATLRFASNSLLKAGCSDVAAYVTHGIFSNRAVEDLDRSSITEITLTDSIGHGGGLPVKFQKLSTASLIAEAIRCIL
ncbi:MAG: ribose-phosphate diphosphokinase [Holosporaceae bacterium]|jgi:ribose-phosphate pyrophosphokinase|nr:ribose-phosphate diphosphokinase [Holosporaceae bacterium]